MQIFNDSNLYVFSNRCVAKSDCRGAAAGAKRTIEICLDPSSVADNAICENESEMCCHEENIQRPCEDYSPDGYQCSEKVIFLSNEN